MFYFLTAHPVALLAIVCLAEVLSMVSFAAWPLFLVDLQPLWGLSNFSAGWISGAYFIGYVLATPVLVGLTDRIDAKYIYIFASFLAFIGALCFALFASDFWSAALSWALVGAGLAGTYMPGLQILNARLGTESRIKLLPYYTSAFGVGTGLSFFLMGWVYSYTSWQNAFLLAAIFSLIAALLVILAVRPAQPAQAKDGAKRHPLDFRPAFKNRAALGYIFAYGAHNFELFAYRGWLFAYLIFAASTYQITINAASLSTLISVFAIIGMSASIIGASFCLRYPRARTISRFGALSALTAILFGLSGFIDFYLILLLALLFNITIMLDSASLTAGTVSAASEHDRGALLAVHTIIGFGGAALGAPTIGFVLDIAGGEADVTAWGIALMTMGLGSALVWLILRRR
ncbi:MAG: MFS transporter [Alphaproteobacteria bacterium]|jgi:MFS family permease|nr:MFS transporter [Alphaproteobacteria bacterium]MBL6777202.1 MFS transporter [Alphaproteobacteria bacterium]